MFIRFLNKSPTARFIALCYCSNFLKSETVVANMISTGYIVVYV